jgi:hypothetical protein
MSNSKFMLRAIMSKTGKLFWSLLTLISPKLNTAAMYWRVHRKRINLKNPNSFNEKLLWLKLHDYNCSPLVIQCSDKFAVREYVSQRGHGKILNELYAKFETVDKSPWRKLENRFALKWNFGCGFNLICPDKENLDIEAAKKSLRKMGKTKYWLTRGELFYKPTKKWIICEKYLGTDGGFWPEDFKFYCFNGVPKAALYIYDRDTEMKLGFVGMDWEYISGAPGYNEIKQLPPKPTLFDEMVNIARDLCEPFPFVRVDFYEFENKIIFGELTFVPTGGHHAVQTTVNGKTMGEMLSLTKPTV